MQVVCDAMEKGSLGINKILDIMDSCLAEPKSGKLNWPLSEKLNVPIAKRAKFMGPGNFQNSVLNQNTVDEETGDFLPHVS